MQSEQQTLPTAHPATTRSRRSRQQWIEIVEQHRQSRCTQSEFCRLNNLSLATFNKWKHRLSKETETGFVAIEPQELAQKTGQENAVQIRLILGDGMALEITKS